MSQRVRLGIKAFQLAVAVAPLFFSAYLISSSAANVPTNDFVELVERMMRILSPGYDLKNLVFDCSMSSHCLLLPLSVHLLNARFFQWNVPLELYLGLGMAALRVILIYILLTEIKHRQGLFSFTLLWQIAYCSLGAGAVTVLLYNETSIAFGTILLAYFLGLFALRYWQETKFGLVVILFCGFLSAMTNACDAMATWLTYLIAALALPSKHRLRTVCTLGLGAVISVLFIVYLLSSPYLSKDGMSPHFPDLVLFLQSVSLIYRRDLVSPAAFPAGESIYGVVLAVCGLLLYLFLLYRYAASRRVATDFAAVPAFSLALAVYGLAHLAAVSFFRTTLAPWYATYSAIFWFALYGLILHAAGCPDSPFQQKGRLMLRMALFLSLVPLIIANLSYKDKDAFRLSHSPATEAALRRFYQCPTYAEQNLFTYTVGEFDRVSALARPLAARGLAAFANKQEVSLQSEFLFANVKIEPACSEGYCAFVDGRRERKWNVPEKLNLAIKGKSAVYWTIDLSSEISSARFESSLDFLPSPGLGRQVAEKQQARLAIYEAGAKTAPLLQKTWQDVRSSRPISIDLHDYLGKSIVLELSADAAPDSVSHPASGAAVVFVYPRLALVKTVRDFAALAARPSKPENTDLSDSFRRPEKSDLCWSLQSDESRFSFEGLRPLKQAAYLLEKQLACFTYKSNLLVDPAQFDRFYIEIGANQSIKPRAVCCQLLLSGNRLESLLLPLLADEAVHGYTYDLKLLGLKAGDKIIGFKVLPAYLFAPNGKDNVLQIERVGFLRRRTN
ncbi:MAG: hypothetical protein LCH63_19055 [Candidatus Melainabacteria bacterium]|nr:hypothetical protein [Candidatus Melainabacteria bacterium]